MIDPIRRACLAALPLFAAVPAHAQTDHFEVWISPAVSTSVGARTTIELEAAQRLRDAADGGRDTVYARLWIHRKLTDRATLSGAIEQRWNEGADERRLHQQLSLKFGAVAMRSRLEQRFVAGDPRMALRFRQRLGVDVPLDAGGRWSGVANAEGFFTLRGGDAGDQTGLTGFRLYAGIGHDIDDRWSVSLGYLRAQDIRRARPDRVGHAPLIGVKLAL